MHSVPQTAPRLFQRVEPEPGFEQIADELAVLVTRELKLRRRAELGGEGLAVIVAHLMAELDDERAARVRVQEIASELSLRLAEERAEREKAEEDARDASQRAEVEASWRRRFKAADRRKRRSMLSLR